MKPNTLYSLLLSALLTLSANIVFAHEGGGADTGGADVVESIEGSAWFVNPVRVVKYCLQTNSEFPVSATVLSEKVSVTLGQWSNFINQSGDYYYQKRSLATQFQEIPCDGSEDLTFYFGMTNAQIELYKARQHNPIAFAGRTQFDETAKWGKGFIWLAPQGAVPRKGDYPWKATTFPDWKQDYQLHAILLHEIGHVFGAAHIEGTIMRTDIADKIFRESDDPENAESWFPKSLFFRISQERMVLFPNDMNLLIPGVLGSYEAFDGQAQYTAPEIIFRLLVGRESKGEIQARVEGRGAHYNPDATTAFDRELILFVKDEKGSYKFKLKMFENAETAIFIEGFSPGMIIGDVGSRDHSEVFPGQVKAKTGKILALQIQLNVASTLDRKRVGPLRINYIDSMGFGIPLFNAGLDYTPGN
jgi:hypothetical protein